ncbi:hypothetical protein NG799_19510 [Laspinema sp. D1]|uniref:Uncharacterized protein n=1 Tax=Laspinema palackyanum D2a TaxID=2953684 RepID=A0ABT2MUU9_9CYAN|nr:hypothetical protein [Laspinema sp. D2a]
MPGKQSTGPKSAPPLRNGETRGDRLPQPPTLTRCNHSIQLAMGSIGTGWGESKASGIGQSTPYPL